MSGRTAKAADLLDAIRALPRDGACTDPAWKTVREWADEWGMSTFCARGHLERGVKSGLAERETRIKRCGQLVRAVPCYRAKEIKV